MVTVPVEGVAQGRAAGILDGRPGGNDLRESVLLHRPAAGVHDGGIHDLLVPTVNGELRMRGIGTVGPGLVPDQPDSIPGTGLDKADQILQVGLIRVIQTGYAACLLQAHHIPGFVGQAHLQRIAGRVGPDAVNDLAVPVIRNIPETVVVVPLQRAAADVQVSDDDRNPFRIEQFPEVLFDGVLGETVPDGQDPEGVPLGGQGRQAQGQEQQRCR